MAKILFCIKVITLHFISLNTIRFVTIYLVSFCNSIVWIFDSTAEEIETGSVAAFDKHKSVRGAWDMAALAVTVGLVVSNKHSAEDYHGENDSVCKDLC